MPTRPNVFCAYPHHARAGNLVYNTRDELAQLDGCALGKLLPHHQVRLCAPLPMPSCCEVAACQRLQTYTCRTGMARSEHVEKKGMGCLSPRSRARTKYFDTNKRRPGLRCQQLVPPARDSMACTLLVQMGAGDQRP